MTLAARVNSIQPFYAMSLMARARTREAAGADIVHMEIGEPDFPTPSLIVQAGQAALAAGHTRYTPASGLPALREAIARYYWTCQGVRVDPRRIVVTPGASGALMLALSLLLETGKEVLLADPTYPCNRNMVRLFGGVPRLLPTDPETRFQLTAQQIAAAWANDTSGVLLASPSNPTGTVVPADVLAAIHEVTARRRGWLLVDEIYHGLIFGESVPTALSISDQVFVVNSFSKFFGMTGWRLGWLVVPPNCEDAADKLAQNVFLAAPTLAQHAALAAFDPETLHELELRRREFQSRRDYLLRALPEIGFKIPVEPDGAFYIYADSSGVDSDSFGLCERVLEEADVVMTPGRDFGDRDAARYVRIAYTSPLPRLAEAVQRLARYFGRR